MVINKTNVFVSSCIVIRAQRPGSTIFPIGCVSIAHKKFYCGLLSRRLETVYMFVMSNVMPFYLSAHRELAIVSSSLHQ